MIVFEGTLSPKCKQYILRQNQKESFLIAWIVSALFFIPTILLSIFWEWIIVFFSIPLLLTPFIAVAPFFETDEGLLYPTKIEIDVQTTPPLLLAESNKLYVLRNLTQVNRVIDMGDWYIFVFYFPHKSKQFICEKRLLCQGTIEEFEQLFYDVLEKKEIKS